MQTATLPQQLPAEQQPKSPAREWWEKLGSRDALAVNLHTQGETQRYVYGFCHCCGAKVWTENSQVQDWWREYLHVGLRMTAEQLKAKLRVSNDSSIVTYELRHNGVPFSFAWRDE